MRAFETGHLLVFNDVFIAFKVLSRASDLRLLDSPEHFPQGQVVGKKLPRPLLTWDYLTFSCLKAP